MGAAPPRYIVTMSSSYDDMRAASGHFWPSEYPVALKQRARDLIDLRCEKAVADDSLDHIEPRGTARDNTHWLPFVAKCEQHFGFRDLKYLDLGCAGGGLVFDFAIRRHFAMGLEGSDFSKINRRAEWATIPDNLFTCDITRRFDIIEKASGAAMQFDVIGLWDVIEHLPEERLDIFFANVRRHLAPDGLFCGTVSTREASHSGSGRNHHETVQPRAWWLDTFERHGLSMTANVFAFQDFPRGNGIIFPANFAERPEEGFHFVLRAASASRD